jgi:hypothetical protein
MPCFAFAFLEHFSGAKLEKFLKFGGIRGLYCILRSALQEFWLLGSDNRVVGNEKAGLRFLAVREDAGRDCVY